MQESVVRTSTMSWTGLMLGSWERFLDTSVVIRTPPDSPKTQNSLLLLVQAVFLTFRIYRNGAISQ